MSDIPDDYALDLLAFDIADRVTSPPDGLTALPLGHEAILCALPAFLREALAERRSRGPHDQYHEAVDPWEHLKPGDPDPFPETGDECGAVFHDHRGDAHLCHRPAHPCRWAHIACYDKVTAVSSHEGRGEPPTWCPISEAPRDGTPIMTRLHEGDEPRALRWHTADQCDDLDCMARGEFWMDDAIGGEAETDPAEWRPMTDEEREAVDFDLRYSPDVDPDEVTEHPEIGVRRARFGPVGAEVYLDDMPDTRSGWLLDYQYCGFPDDKSIDALIDGLNAARWWAKHQRDNR